MTDHSVAQLISSLKLVCWSSTSSTSTLLSQLQIKHGFIGTALIPPNQPCLAPTPHHIRQVHGTDIIASSNLTTPSFSEAENSMRPPADGLYSTTNQCIAVKTADCLPVLISSTDGAFTAAVHAGWRGLTAGILMKAVHIAKQHHPLAQCRFVIGPAISREAFEVGPEIVEAMKGDACGLHLDAWALPVSKGKLDRWHIDLSLAATLQLILAGVEPHHIEVIRACTVNDQKDGNFLWNSFRRQGKACPSNWAWIQGK